MASPTVYAEELQRTIDARWHRGPRPKTIIDRFLAKVTPGPSGCWIWTGGVAANGYAQFWTGQKNAYAHRFAHLCFVGPIAAGLHVDHVCHNEDEACRPPDCLHRRCVNPAHLEAVTPSVNSVRSPHTMAHRWAIRTHCDRGHEFTPENTLIRESHRSPGSHVRYCRACGRIWAVTSKNRARAKEMAA